MPDERVNVTPDAPLASVRRFMRPRRPQQRCELCSAGLPLEHAHLLDLSQRELLCACNACAVLFNAHRSGLYRRVPQRAWWLTDFELRDQLWAGLRVPAHLAFLVVEASPQSAVRAMRPSRAGATESRPPQETWQAILAENPVLQRMQPEVEALLVNRLGAHRDYYLVPIDACYRLVALIRAHWHGLSGGSELWGRVERFFTELRERATPLTRSAHA